MLLADEVPLFVNTALAAAVVVGVIFLETVKLSDVVPPLLLEVRSSLLSLIGPGGGRRGGAMLVDVEFEVALPLIFGTGCMFLWCLLS